MTVENLSNHPITYRKYAKTKMQRNKEGGPVNAPGLPLFKKVVLTKVIEVVEDLSNHNITYRKCAETKMQ